MVQLLPSHTALSPSHEGPSPSPEKQGPGTDTDTSPLRTEYNTWLAVSRVNIPQRAQCCKLQASTHSITTCTWVGRTKITESSMREYHCTSHRTVLTSMSLQVKHLYKKISGGAALTVDLG